jgi:G3E family GTPase
LERGLINRDEIPESARAYWTEPHGDRRQELVFIGIGFDAAALRAELAACLQM